MKRLLRRFRKWMALDATAEDTPASVAVVAAGADRERLRSVFRDRGLSLRMLESCGDARRMLESNGPASIVLYDSRLPEPPWNQAVAALAAAPSKPAVVLLSDHVDHSTKSDLIRSGGYDLLRTPIDAESVEKMVASAWIFWLNRQAIRHTRG